MDVRTDLLHTDAFLRTKISWMHQLNVNINCSLKIAEFITVKSLVIITSSLVYCSSTATLLSRHYLSKKTLEKTLQLKTHCQVPSSPKIERMREGKQRMKVLIWL